MVWSYLLTAMTKRNGERRIYKSQDKTGYRVYIGRKYLGYAASKGAANGAMPPVERKHEPEKMPSHKEYKYVISRQTKKGPMYHGSIWVQKKIKKRTQWTKKYFPRVKSPKAAATLVAEYLETTLASIKVKKSSRESPARSADRMAFLCDVFVGGFRLT